MRGGRARRRPRRVAVRRQSVEGEPSAIFPFLGSSRLEEPINRYQVTAVFHGHAHHGSPEGKTLSGIPVYNVALSLMKKTASESAPFRVLEVPVPASAANGAGMTCSARPPQT